MSLLLESNKVTGEICSEGVNWVALIQLLVPLPYNSRSSAWKEKQLERFSFPCRDSSMFGSLSCHPIDEGHRWRVLKCVVVVQVWTKSLHDKHNLGGLVLSMNRYELPNSTKIQVLRWAFSHSFIKCAIDNLSTTITRTTIRCATPITSSFSSWRLTDVAIWTLTQIQSKSEFHNLFVFLFVRKLSSRSSLP